MAVAHRKPRKPDDCGPLIEAVRRGEVTLTARARGKYPGIPLEAGRLPGLRTIGYWDAVGPQTWGLPMHRNEGIEICYLLSGETVFATDQESVVLRPGDLTITRPWQRHRLGDPHIRACRLFWVILDVEGGGGRTAWEFPGWIGPDAASRRELLRILRANPRCHVADTGSVLREYLARACERMGERGPLALAHSSDVINHLFLSVARILSDGGAAGAGADPHGFNRTVEGFFRGLEASVESSAEPWTVGSIARACRVGVTYLTALCKKMFNATPCEHLTRIRLAHAARMLRQEPARPVTEIAYAVGFGSSQYFATCFRRQYGSAPHLLRGDGS